MTETIPSPAHREAALPQRSDRSEQGGRSELPDPLRLVDTRLLRVFAAGQWLGIAQMMEVLGVTATAIRQRLERLMEAGLIERRKVISGRGRPAFDYRLTVQGQRHAGADATELAEAMWQEILGLPDGELRRGLLAGIAKRLGQSYADRITAGAGDLSLGEKMQLLSGTLAAQQMEACRDDAAAGLPLLNICSCPYPSLRDASGDRSMCQLEEEIFSEALGSPVRLSHCVLDGDRSCHFVPTANDSQS